MIKQYINIGFKRLVAFRLYSIINIVGFAIAIAVCLAILLFTHYHFSFDKYITDGENSYRIISRYGDGTHNANTFACFDDVLNDCPEVASHTIVYNIHHIDEIYVGDDKIKCNEVIFANVSFLNFFSAEMLEGDKQSINQPNTMFVTPTMAKKLFPDKEAINQTVFVKSFTANRDSLIGFTITGIIKPLPETSHLGYEILLSQKGHFSPTVEILKDRKVFGAAVYAKLFPNTNIKALELGITQKVAPILKGAHGPPPEAFNHKLQAIYDIHFSNDTINEMRPTVGCSSMYILLLVGLLVFAIATINFINIHIARASFHSKQSKIIVFLGGNKKHIFSNIFIEVMLSVTISFLIAIIFLVVFSKPLTNQFFIDWNISFQNAELWAITAILFLVVGIIVSLFCSSIFINKISQLRQIKLAVPLMVFQFVLVIALIGFTILINKQMHFVNQKELGYSSENVLIIQINQRNSKINTFRDELFKLPGVISAATAQHYPGFHFQDMNFSIGDNSFPFKFGFIDQYAIKTLNINTLQYFKAAKEKSTDGWYINESFYNKLKGTYSEEQIAASNFLEDESQADENNQEFVILGVISDFHYASLHSEIESFAFFIPKPDTRYNRFLLVRVNQSGSHVLLGKIEKIMHEIYPDQSFNYQFLDEQLNNQYHSEQSLLKLINLFSVLAIIIACLGLIGLSLFMIEKHTKEIGIRKVNGATVYEIIQMLNKDFIRWIAIAFAIAVPISYFAMQKWLENFAYKTTVSWWIFALAGLLTLTIALLTVSWQSWRAATRNPVEALRYE
ncbi:MAG: ABC transporter permease [Bacteroidetes bacterium]|nr:ABC transporter permease [Bacteroidota bacterium]